MKKIITILLTLLLFCGVLINVSADEQYPVFYSKTEQIFNFKIKEQDLNNAGLHDHVFKVYQILVGDLYVESATTKTLSNITWGKDIDGAAVLTTVKNNASLKENYKDATTASEFAESLAKSSHEQLMAGILHNNLKTDAAAITLVEEVGIDGETPTGYYKLPDGTKLIPGYYLVVDEMDQEGVAPSRYITAVLGNVITEAKSQSMPTLSKYVNDSNDSKADTKIHSFDKNTAYSDLNSASWMASADHDLNDVVMYELKALLPKESGTAAENNLTGMTRFDEYVVKFTDKLSKGLDFIYTYSDTLDTDEQIYNFLTGESSSAIKNDIRAFIVPENSTTARKELTIIPKAMYDVLKGSSNADYKAKVNDCLYFTIEKDQTSGVSKLVIGSDNINIYGCGAHDGDILRIFYKAKLNKDNAVVGYDQTNRNDNEVYLEYTVDGSGKLGQTHTDDAVVYTWELNVNKVIKGTTTPLDGADFKLEKYNATSRTYELVTTVKDPQNAAIFKFVGIDDGYYRLTETETPKGYNSIKPIYFEIIANHLAEISDMVWLKDADLNPTHIDLSVSEVQDEAHGFAKIDKGSFNQYDTSSDGIISVNVENARGVVLPETGGMGTTLFYIGGSILVVGSALALIVKKKTTH